jgi:hypothetical protein
MSHGIGLKLNSLIRFQVFRQRRIRFQEQRISEMKQFNIVTLSCEEACTHFCSSQP